jgi:hypothetical protein
VAAKYWIVVASKNHVQRGVGEGFAQACHGKPGPLKRMQAGDWVIYYSSKLEFGQPTPCQCFTAIGQVVDDVVYQHAMSPDFVPFRRNVQFQPCAEIPIGPLIPQLSFISNKQRWGGVFRFGMLQIGPEDFALLSGLMLPAELERQSNA